MKCPQDSTDLVKKHRDGVDMEYCQSCGGMWLTRQELNQLEDDVFDRGDENKGTLVASATETTLRCPECNKPMERFEYRFYELEMDFCEDGHGFWLDKDSDKRVLEIMKKEETGLERKVRAEDKWASNLRHIRSGSFLDKIRNLFQ
jgi:Zn-finger nucleic acid-binding protein